ncbi:MAG TPA: hypothetical protein VGW34_15000, partial [Allosphingosinicella sp.]|nr:hypothetical protein [Allosphingosinicella sp.]
VVTGGSGAGGRVTTRGAQLASATIATHSHAVRAENSANSGERAERRLRRTTRSEATKNPTPAPEQV